MGRRRAAIALLALATALVSLPAAAAPPTDDYVVVLEPTTREVPEIAQEIARAHSGEIGFVYTTALQGFTIELPPGGVAGLERNPNVAYVEPVQEVLAFGTQPIPTGIDRIEWDLNPPTVPMDVDIAILDTGVYIGQNPDGSARSHLDLNLRYVSDCTDAIFYPLIPSGCKGSGDFQDGHGHGTHVAGIAAALDNDIGSIGVAPGATLWSFKVLENDGTGTTGTVLAGIDAVASQAHLIEVANMSLGFQGSSQAIDDAIANAVDAGVVFVVAAGNSAADASTFSPASGPDVITVSAVADFDGLPLGLGSPTCRSDVDDTLADFSNYGPAVEIAAPGVCIYSTDLNDGYSVKSGTSMASPFVAGAVARYLAESGIDPQSRADVMSIRSAIIGDGIPQSQPCGFTDVDTSPEPLLFLNGPLFGGDGSCETATEPANSAPSADFTASCIDLTCNFTDLSTDSDGTIVSWSWDFGDTQTSTQQNPSHSYASGGTYTVTLTVTDDAGATGGASQIVTVSSPVNQAPTADFATSCTDLTCNFTDLSTDSDGTIVSWSWDFGDTQTSTQQSPSHSYASAGTYTVTLTVTDDAGATDTASQSVTASEPAQSTTIVVAAYPIIIDSADGRDAHLDLWVTDSLGEPLAGALVEGTWSYSDKNGRTKTFSDSGTTEAGGTVFTGNITFSRKFPPGSTIEQFCVTNVTLEGYTYGGGVPCAIVLSEASSAAVHTLSGRID